MLLSAKTISCTSACTQKKQPGSLLALASWMIFGEPPDAWFYLGAPMIIGSGIYIWLRERKLNRAVTIEPVED